MVFAETLGQGILHVLAWVFDILTYIPYYFIQEPRTALELSNRQVMAFNSQLNKNLSQPLPQKLTMAKEFDYNCRSEKR